MRILAFDFSLVNTGVCAGDETPISSVIHPGKRRGMERHAYIRDRVLALIREHRPERIIMEELPLGANSNGTKERSELIGACKLLFHDLDIPFTEVNPMGVKIYATGDGKSDKDAIIANAIRRFGYLGSNNDEADALILWHIGQHLAGEQRIKVPAAHLRGKALTALGLVA